MRFLWIPKLAPNKKPQIFSKIWGFLKNIIFFNNTKYEYDVLWHLCSNKERIYSRDDLIEILFSDSDAYDRVIDAYIKNIRKKLDDSANQPKYIKTHYGLGYQFVGETDD